MHADLPSFHVKPELISKIRDYFRIEADKTYTDEAILAAIHLWFEDRLDRMSEEIGDVLTSPHLAESRRFREILESSTASAQAAAPQVAPETVAEPAKSVFTGFREFSPSKLGAMIEYIARSGRDIYKTNLNKLLFYSDFTFFYLHHRGISGATYLNLPYGPVPDMIENVLDRLTASSKIVRQPVPELGSNAQIIKPGKPVEDDSNLSEDEMKTLDWVLDHYGDLSPTSISDLSHREKAYTSTRPMEPIAYEYAKFFENLPEKD